MSRSTLSIPSWTWALVLPYALVASAHAQEQDPFGAPDQDPLTPPACSAVRPPPPDRPQQPAPPPSPTPPAPAQAPAPAPNAPAPATAPAPAAAQAPTGPIGKAGTAQLSGLVRERGLRDPLPGVRVTLSYLKPPADGPQEPRSAVTDLEGRFSFTDLPPGEVSVRLAGAKVRPSKSTETLRENRRLEVTYWASTSKNPFEAVVRAEPIRKDVVEQVLNIQELRRIPGTQNDALKAVQNLPGVARAPFGGGQLVVWGSAPGDTRVYADGVFIPRLYHFGGLRATINSEFVSELTFKPGAYGADYGRGLGGVVNITTRSPRSDRIHGSVTLDLIDGSLTLEGPITKKLYFAAGARISWISVFLPIFNRSSFQISPFYWDYQLALRYRPTPKDDIDFLAFGSQDTVTARVSNPDPTLQINIDSHNYYSRVLGRWTHRFARDTVLNVMPSVGADRISVDAGDSGIGGRQLKLNAVTIGYNLRSELRHRFLPWLDSAFGLDLEGLRTQFDVLSPGAGGPSSSGDGFGTPPLTQALRDAATFNIIGTAPYVIARLELLDRRLVISPQLRLELAYQNGYDSTNMQVLAEPRVTVSGAIIPGRLWLKAAAGVYHQPPQGAEISKVFGNPALLQQYSAAYVGGLDLDVTPTLHVEMQGFYKDLRSMVVADSVTKFSNGGLGRVYGGEMLVRQRLWHNFFGWLAYTLSRSERKDAPDLPWRLFRFDQTHILTLVASYQLPRGFEVGVRFRYVTGNPFTPNAGPLPDLSVRDCDPSNPTNPAVRNTASQTYERITGDAFSSRLPDFHQLDIRLDKTWTFKMWKLGLYLDVQNIYNQANTETLVFGGRQLCQVGRVTGIPVFPNLGLRAEF